ncbi:hypothetical protein [Acidithiobacillus caldus]|uniref:Uncharacterized protein n=1 Tax=Acidithiobacillus caldus (strain ATCC 51756 / DSM 8584 / KU) TaxID=637389 RepID=A0A059ZVN0_ACICK|nr:hypothetical protein [Acidithiobacillus caldus]AFU62896.1 phage tail fiber-like protein [Acidithiobacillus phage AcaML1]AIA54026.1 hypothetical protein Acaty_c0134 [Acidithiobacillus caldus ATCC 51756]MBU2729846.1 hypothetical protein [Acidithiobacillus caldus]MBU2736769.1 hypothetical protein [Acidithiobacillus caldus ATCC 51756]MBU2743893.1 hypothetical protein [Acidithiobacillus caldus]
MGLLATLKSAAGTAAVLYTVPTGRSATVNLSACNAGQADARVRVAVGTGDAPPGSGWIEFDATLASSSVLERTAIALAAGERLFVQASTADVCFNAWGIEEVA